MNISTYNSALQNAREILATEPDVEAVLIAAPYSAPSWVGNVRLIECDELVAGNWRYITRDALQEN